MLYELTIFKLILLTITSFSNALLYCEILKLSEDIFFFLSNLTMHRIITMQAKGLPIIYSSLCLEPVMARRQLFSKDISKSRLFRLHLPQCHLWTFKNQNVGGHNCRISDRHGAYIFNPVLWFYFAQMKWRLDHDPPFIRIKIYNRIRVQALFCGELHQYIINTQNIHT